MDSLELIPPRLEVNILNSHPLRPIPDLIIRIEEQHDRHSQVRLEEIDRLFPSCPIATRSRRRDSDPELRSQDGDQGRETDPGPYLADGGLVDEV